MTEEVIAVFDPPKNSPYYVTQVFDPQLGWRYSSYVEATRDVQQALKWAKNLAESAGVKTRVVER